MNRNETLFLAHDVEKSLHMVAGGSRSSKQLEGIRLVNLIQSNHSPFFTNYTYQFTCDYQLRFLAIKSLVGVPLI